MTLIRTTSNLQQLGISEDQAKFCVYNSLLSEAAVLGFDYGYSLGCPQMLAHARDRLSLERGRRTDSPR